MDDMYWAVRASVDAATHLSDDDMASVEVAYQLAQYIDAAHESGDQARIDKTTFGAYPTLNKVLTGLGLNPEGKQRLGLNDSDPEGDEF